MIKLKINEMKRTVEKRSMRKQAVMAIGLVIAGFALSAAAIDGGLSDYYWDSPSASLSVNAHDWSTLEQNLQPEACAQCHVEQFNAWKDSLHAHAYSSGLVGQFTDMGHQNANDCLVCHAPLKEQLYTNPSSMDASIALRLQHQEGFDRAGDLNAVHLPLRHSGVSCAVCHVRGGQRFGPPSKTTGAIGKQHRAVHGGFTATSAFEQSQFCASCHQFPQSMAINGKPLENTLNEWKDSRFSSEGVTCQQCHMPDRKHEFRGIHSPEMVKKGLTFQLSQQHNNTVLNMTSVWIGHAFPSYVTPKVIIEADAKNSNGDTLKHWHWEIIREVEYDNGWQEVRDTRLLPGETRQFIAKVLPAHTVSVLYRVQVIPDYFYKGVYESLLQGQITGQARAHIKQASTHADKNDYTLYEQEIQITSLK